MVIEPKQTEVNPWRQAIKLKPVLVTVILVLVLLPLFASQHFLYVMIEVFIVALFSVSFNFVYGRTGLLSFGHPAFYGIGAYSFALLLKKALFPFPVAILAGPIIALLCGILVGFLSVRLTARFAFAFLTLAFMQMFYYVVLQWRSMTGGDDGLIGLPIPHWLNNVVNDYYFTFVFSTIFIVLLYYIYHSPFGRICQAIRENPERVTFSGINVQRFRWAAFSISTFFCGISGVLVVIQQHAAFPDYLGVQMLLLGYVACVLGGLRTFFGPTLGAVIVVFLDKFLGSVTVYWSSITGLIFIIMLLFFGEGILGTLSKRLSNVKIQSLSFGGEEEQANGNSPKG